MARPSSYVADAAFPLCRCSDLSSFPSWPHTLASKPPIFPWPIHHPLLMQLLLLLLLLPVQRPLLLCAVSAWLASSYSVSVCLILFCARPMHSFVHTRFHSEIHHHTYYTLTDDLPLQHLPVTPLLSCQAMPCHAIWTMRPCLLHLCSRSHYIAPRSYSSSLLALLLVLHFSSAQPSPAQRSF